MKEVAWPSGDDAASERAPMRGYSIISSASESRLSEIFTPHPSAGFFCNGEIGPVGGRNFVHGYTASAALFT